MTVFSELRMRPTTDGRAGWNASTTARLVLAGVVLFILLVGANLATPLYPLLQAKLGLSAMDVAAAFCSYILALVAVLMLAGHWSDHIGRRAALVLAVLVGMAGGLFFAAAESLVALCAGRIMQGVSVGLATGASSAALRELLPQRPEWASRFTLLASAGGVALGPALGGLLSLLPGSISAPFYVQAGVLLAVLVPLLVLQARPAATLPQGPRPFAALAPRRPAVSRQARGAFWMAAAVGFLSFAVFGFCLSLGPAYFAGIIGTAARPVVGLLAGITLGASAVSQLLPGQLLPVRGRFVIPAGLAVLGASMMALVASAFLQNPWLLIGASVTAGLGQGIAFRTVFNEVAGKVEPARHAQVISTVYVITYLGSALPVLGLGLAASTWGLQPSAAGFGLACGTAALVLAAVALVRARR